jgi:hypothetical protein
LLGGLPRFGIVETFILQLQLVGLQPLGRREGLALIGTLAGQHQEGFEPAADQFITQEELDVGGRAGPAAERKEVLQRRGAVKTGAVQQI